MAEAMYWDRKHLEIPINFYAHDFALIDCETWTLFNKPCNAEKIYTILITSIAKFTNQRRALLSNRTAWASAALKYGSDMLVYSVIPHSGR